MEEYLVRYKQGKHTFEVLVNEGTVAKFREGTITNIDDVLQIRNVYTHASYGTKASDEELAEVFGTADEGTVLTTILREGDAQESAHERQEKMDAKHQEIITVIQKHYMTPEGHPLPVTRIENALAEIKPRIDVDVDAERQVASMYSKLSEVMPMKRGVGGMEGTVTVSLELSGVVSTVIRKHATVHREVFGDQAKYFVEIHEYDLLMKDLVHATDGDFQMTLDSAPGSNMVHDQKGEAETTHRVKGRSKN